MALYDNEDTILVNPGEAAPEGYTLRGRMGPVGQEQDYYERTKNVSQPAPTGPQAQAPTPDETGIERDFQFLQTAMDKLGYNPYSINPMGDAVREFQANESRLFNQAFGHTDMTPTTLTPEALRYWNEQKQLLIAQKANELTGKATQGRAILDDVMKLYRERTAFEEDKRRNEAAERERRYKEGLGKTLPEGAVTELANMKTTFDRLDAVGKKIDTMKDKVGPIEGRLSQLRVKWYNEGATQATINELNSLITIAYSLSGKQISKAELDMLRDAMLPTMTQPEMNLKATIDFAKNWMASTHNDRLDYLKKARYDVGGFSQVGVKRAYDPETREIVTTYHTGEVKRSPAPKAIIDKYGAR